MSETLIDIGLPPAFPDHTQIPESAERLLAMGIDPDADDSPDFSHP